MDNGKDSSNDGYRAQLVASYLKRAGSFRKLLTALLGFTAAFGFFIAWPYLAAVKQERQLAHDIRRIDAELAQLAQQHDRYQRPKQAVQALSRMIDSGPRMLRDYILGLNGDTPFRYPDHSAACAQLTDPPQAQSGLPFSPPNMPAQIQLQQFTPDVGQFPSGGLGALQQLRPDSCAEQQGQERLVCRIDRFVQFQLCEYQQGFREQVLPALAELQDDGKPLFDQAELDQQFARVRDALQRHVADNPTFWHTVSGKGEMGVQLQREVQTLWDAIAARIEPVAQELQQRMEQARERQAQLKADSATLAAQRAALGERLAKIQSPIGNLPIGLSESVLLFPVVLAIGFGMATASLLEQLRLRRALLDAEQRGSDGEILSSAQVAQVAPLWIEPAVPTQHKLARWLLLLTPLLAFAATVMAIAREGRAALLATGPAAHWIYWLLYAASGLAFLACLWLMRRGMSGLDRESINPPAS